MDFSLLGFKGLQELFNLHPLFVHLPIALFPLSLIFYLLSIKIKKEGFQFAAQLLLIFATFSAVAATVSGLIAEDSIPHNETIHHMMQTHEKMAFVIVGGGILVSIWSFIRKENKPRFFAGFIGMLALICLVLSLNADLGARMVYIEGAAVKPASTLIEQQDAGHPHEHNHSPRPSEGKYGIPPDSSPETSPHEHPEPPHHHQD